MNSPETELRTEKADLLKHPTREQGVRWETFVYGKKGLGLSFVICFLDFFMIGRVGL